ncbi:MAG: alpha-hydroxy acid oxidase [Neisseriaceae bacterium]
MRLGLNKITCIEDLFAVYSKRVPKMFYDYCESGSWSEQTFLENKADFKKIYLRQRVLRDLSQRSVHTNLLGEHLSMPVVLAPVGLTGMQHADGEILAAKAAKRFGIPYTLSTMSICSLEEVAEYTDYHPFWFQLYMMKDRDFMKDLMLRAQKAGCSALVLTVDLQIIGQRHKDIKNGLTTPPKITFKNLLNLATKPYWCKAMLKTRRYSFGNIIGYRSDISNVGSLSAWITEQFDIKLSWKDIDWIKQHWKGPLILKGIMEAEDALHAINSGVDAIVVSNHGGRQLDGAPSSISVLKEVIQAVDQKIEVLLDGGIRSGQDILKTLALGAKAVMLGRPYIYGLGAYGEEGVYQVLSLLQKELDLTMAFCGVTNTTQISSAILRS